MTEPVPEPVAVTEEVTVCDAVRDGVTVLLGVTVGLIVVELVGVPDSVPELLGVPEEEGVIVLDVVELGEGVFVTVPDRVGVTELVGDTVGEMVLVGVRDTLDVEESLGVPVIVPDKDGVGVTDTVDVIVPVGVAVSLGVIVEVELSVGVTDGVLVVVVVGVILGVPVGLDVALNDSTEDEDSVCDIVDDPVLVLVSNALLLAVTVLNALLDLVAEADCDPEDVCEELDDDEIYGDTLSDIILDTEVDLSDVGVVSKVTEGTTELEGIGDSDGFIVCELDGSNDNVPGIEAVATCVDSVDADTDGDTNDVGLPSRVADTDSDTNGVGVASVEYELNMLDDAVVLSVDDVESLICGVFVRLCMGDRDAVEGSVWERVACSEDDCV